VAAENHISTQSLLKPHMRTITVEHGEVLHGSSSEIEFAYFPQSTIISVLARTEHGQTAETSIVGREGMIGSSSIHGIMTSFAECVVQVAGEAVRVPVSEIHRVGKASESFRKVIALFDLSLLRKRSNRLPARPSIKLSLAQQGGFSSAANDWEAMTSG
jgi:CRP-like cAMP-binding protein